ncbi:hypothetical protein BJ878DRAFT_481812 [Calycina marina]|uniref:Enoyl reductase (ER) domain-containing protein n=1 Tax=Calycina marina TaxID=1763456 RepID=A0A9P7YZN0_9HELO|nr:hypothetical protein BJ878DRAFT_481812 [Calycina marina]
MVQNKGLIFRAIPDGLPVPGKDIVVETRDFDLGQAPPVGGVTTKNLYASFDPYQRGKMRDAKIKSYAPAYEIGEIVSSGSIMKILKSDNEKFKEGDIVTGNNGYEEYSSIKKEIADGLRLVVNPYNLDPKVFLGPLGMPGLTAYSSLYEIGKPQQGETIFISAASGAVGQLVGQLAKHEGLRVIGSVGSDEKLDYIIKELKFDGGFNYKTEKPADALARLAPDGIDIYYENARVQLEAALEAMNDFGRIVACGMVSEYNKATQDRYGIKNLINIVGKRITFRGFIVGDKDLGPKYYHEWAENVSKWLHEGTFKAKESVTDGIDNSGEGFVGMLQGKNFGKAILNLT